MNIKNRGNLVAGACLIAGLTIFTVQCKKVDLERIAAVRTMPADNISSSSATVYADIIDLGSEDALDDHGFCWAVNQTPTVNNFKIGFDKISSTDSYNTMLTGLSGNTNYIVRAYVMEGKKVQYGNEIKFTTLPNAPSSEWLHYDNGSNYDGIGITGGGNFDIAILFTTYDLQPYNGYRISKIKFYPREDYPTFYMTIWEGSPPVLVYDEQISYISTYTWVEFSPPTNYYIDASQDLMVGYWVYNQPDGYYPAGVDSGPSVTGYGDLISFDDGDTWDALSILDPSNLDYNWNLEVYVTMGKDKEVQLKRNPDVLRDRVRQNANNAANQVNVSSAKYNQFND